MIERRYQQPDELTLHGQLLSIDSIVIQFQIVCKLVVKSAHWKVAAFHGFYHLAVTAAARYDTNIVWAGKTLPESARDFRPECDNMMHNFDHTTWRMNAATTFRNKPALNNVS